MAQIRTIFCFIWNYACERVELPLVGKMSLCRLEKALLLGRQIRKRGCLAVHFVCCAHSTIVCRGPVNIFKYGLDDWQCMIFTYSLLLVLLNSKKAGI